MFFSDMSIDLGTATMQVYVKNKGIILSEPTVIAVNKETGRIRGVGSRALDMLGRTPPEIEAVRPLSDGVISNFTLCMEMIKAFLGKVLSRNIKKPRIMMCVPSGITNVEQRAVIDAAREVGARDVYIIEEPVAAALGAGIDISEAKGTLVIDIGGGTTDIAVISLGGVVSGRSLKIAGDEFTDAIVRYVRKKHKLIIGPRTAERIKKEIGTVVTTDTDSVCTAKGLCAIDSLPREIQLTSHEISTIFDDLVHNITERVKEVLESTPAELHRDIIDEGIIMTGGGAKISGLDERISAAIGVKVRLADDIENCVVKGAAIALSLIDESNGDPTKHYYKKAYIRQ